MIRAIALAALIALALPARAEDAPVVDPVAPPAAAAPAAPAAAAAGQVTITFERAELEIIYDALLDRPAKQVIPLLSKLQKAAAPPPAAKP